MTNSRDFHTWAITQETLQPKPRLPPCTTSAPSLSHDKQFSRTHMGLKQRMGSESSEEEEKKGLQTHLDPKEMEVRGVSEREEKVPLLYCSCTAPGPQALYKGSNFPTHSPPKQNILPNATHCGLISINTAISCPHFSHACSVLQLLSRVPCEA